MEAREYDALAVAEFDHWWFRGLHDVLIDWLRERNVGPGCLVLDAGCGTGGLAARLGAALSCRTIAFDVSRQAADHWSTRGLTQACVASIERIPFATGEFDAALSVDVLESEGVEPGRAMGELARVVRPGGWIVIVVPAYRWMLGDAHHRAVRAVRRFALSEAASLATKEGLDVVRSTHFFALPFPAIALRRLVAKFWPRSDLASDLAPPAPWLNGVLRRLMKLEGRLLRWFDMPIGTSILLLARKGREARAHG